jgi:2-oxoisovalerate dehydrogenase E2 component (dihydrolipoyl transacylase)
MAELEQFKLPDVGEGLTEAEIVRWHVQPGDKVTVNQIIVEIETAKAVVELPCPWEGVVVKLLVPEGTTADVGTPIISVSTGPDASADVDTDPGAATQATQAAPAATAGPSTADGGASPEPRNRALSEDLVPPPPPPERQAVLVGYGVKLGATTRRPRKRPATTATAPSGGPQDHPTASTPPAASTPSPPPTPSPPAPPVSASTSAPTVAEDPMADPADVDLSQLGKSEPLAGRERSPVLAKPPVRKLAKDRGVDLSAVTGTGPGDTITRDDVLAAASTATNGATASGAAASSATASAPPAPAGTAASAVPAGPREERIPVRGIRKHTAAAVTASAFTAPHVTEFLQIDITETMAAVTRLRSLPDFAGIRVSPLLLVAKALLISAARHPMITSSWDEAAQEIILRHYVNLGIAAATERGLIVPNIKDAHALGLPALAQALHDLAETARAGHATPADLRGGTITITNVGVFGVDSGTPILTPGEAAILAFGRVREAPWVHEGQLAVRQVTTLALSFDHRIVDGDLGSAVLTEVGAMLTDPLRMIAWG